MYLYCGNIFERMKLRIIHTGKTKLKYVEEVCSDYKKRIGRYISLEEFFTGEIKNAGSLPPDELRNREAGQLLHRIDQSDYLVLFDENGKQYSSIEFAGWLEKKMILGKHLVFSTGGAYGYGEEACKRADEKISLSK
jgi:23S rRNA (pseudouridine1915-N3)-methyltransferase